MKKIFRSIALAAGLAGMLTGAAYAAELNDIDKVYGLESLMTGDAEKVNEGVKDVPDDVIKLFNRSGGTVTLENKAFTDGEKNLLGLYYYADSRIFVNPVFPAVITHELGHFVYAKGYAGLSDKSKKTLSDSYAVRSKFDDACFSEDETFAVLYAIRRSEETYGISNSLTDEESRMIEEAEAVCGKVLLGLESNGGKYGPGIYAAMTKE